MPHPEADRLFPLDAALRAEADAMLADSGIGPVLHQAGYVAVGSYVMRTMVWRDLDFERHAEPDWSLHWQIGTRLAETRWCVRLQCIDVYREAWMSAQPDFGYYWGVRVAPPSRSEPTPPGDPSVWKLDIWTARPEEFRTTAPLRARWASLMTDELRSYVLAIKEAVWGDPEYRKSLLSIHVYEAVLEHGVRGVEEFREWWRARYAGTPGA
jgi:hypothetical protein